MEVLDRNSTTSNASCQCREPCPDCSSPLMSSGNCGFCPSCGFSECG
ncbi:MAG: hypothetical protein LN415_01850 [Candidatus Thermoplasmatota archaeon]|nr:hypothetical protein [Candidatus Thermoplasmatota archaeon]